MNKTVGSRIISFFLATLLLLFSFTSCAKNQSDKDFYASFSVKEKAIIQPEILQNGKKSYTGVDGDTVNITFKTPTKVNTVILSETGDNILEFEISAFDQEDQKFETIYKQDKVGSFRYCAFPEEETTALKVTITKTKANTFTLKDVDVLQAEHNRKDLRVAAYVVAGSVLGKQNIDAAHFDVITDAILFGAVSFNEEGHLVYHDFELDGSTINGKDALKQIIADIRAVEGNKPKKIHINLLGPDGDVKEKEKKHNVVFKKHANVLIAEIKTMLEELGADGVYFDYEYPYKRSGWKAYSDFLVELREGLGETKQIGTALGPWGRTLTKKAQEAVNFYEMMTYDMFDDDGYHATFQSAIDGMQYAQKQHLDFKKCDLGLPFYGRPVDKAAFWPSYESSVDVLGKFGNLDTTAKEYTIEENGQQITKQSTANYFNGYQMIYDKTAFALDSGISGLMIWHYACDIPMEKENSLFKAIQDAIEDRNAD